MGPLFYLYRVIKEERPIFWEVILSVLMKKKVHLNKCIILSGFRVKVV